MGHWPAQVRERALSMRSAALAAGYAIVDSWIVIG
jgi:hypothetical protein